MMKMMTKKVTKKMMTITTAEQYHRDMTQQFVLRLTDEDAVALREQAEAEHTSMQAVALAAVRERTAGRARVLALLQRARTKHAETLRVLADS